jgi:hypothetical protein
LTKPARYQPLIASSVRFCEKYSLNRCELPNIPCIRTLFVLQNIQPAVAGGLFPGLPAVSAS